MMGGAERTVAKGNELHGDGKYKLAMRSFTNSPEKRLEKHPVHEEREYGDRKQMPSVGGTS
jgi:hypothetical protein